MIKQKLRKWCGVEEGFRTFMPVGVTGTSIRMLLEISDGTIEVSGCEAAVVLRPFMIAIRLSEEIAKHAEAVMVPELDGQRLGRLDLKQRGSYGPSECPFTLYHTAHSENVFRRRHTDLLFRTILRRQMDRNPNPSNFRMDTADLMHMMVYYTAPRPVVLVGVRTFGGHDIFPMDLTGPMGPGYYVLGLRNTSAGVKAIRDSSVVAVGDVSFNDRAWVYGLGRHRLGGSINLAESGREIRRTSHFQIPMPSNLLRVRELKIIHEDSIGSHSIFCGQVVSDTIGAHGSQLAHIQWFYFNALRQGVHRNNAVELA